MNKIIKVARREYVETVKTKTFMLSILITPLLIVAVILIANFLQEKSYTDSRPPRDITVIGLSSELAGDLNDVFEEYNESHSHRLIRLRYESTAGYDLDDRVEELKSEVISGELFGLLVIEEGILDNEGKALFYTKNVTDFEFFSTVRRLINTAVFNTRFRRHDLSPQLIGELRRSVPVVRLDLSTGRETTRNEFIVIMVPFFFLMLMFIGIFLTGQGLLMSVIEEKSSRVIEVLLAAVTPFQLMAGKILGQSAVGLTLVGAYGAATYLTATLRGMGDLLNTGIFGYFAIYFVLGFLFISSVYTAIGSACNSVKEAQNLMGMPIMLFYMVPLIAWGYIVQHPESSLALILSFIPPMTPMVMVLRIVARPDLPLLQIILSILVLAISVFAVMWLAAKVFRTGILMYGKPPSLRELFRWLRYN